MENKINIAMFSDSFYPIIGGRENVIHNLMQGLSNKTNCFLLTTTFKGHDNFINDNELPYEVHRCKSLRITKNEYLSIIDRKTKKLIKQKILSGQIDIIHTHTKFALAKYAIKLGKRYNIPVITTAHTNYIEQYKNQLKLPIIYKPLLRYVKSIINKTDHVITVSKHMQNVLNKIGVNTNSTIISNGNDLLQYEFSNNEKNDILKEFNLENEKNIFIYVGRISDTKNLDFLLTSLSLLKQSGSNFKMLIVGKGEIDKYKALATKLNINDDCIFTGPITDRKKIALLYSISSLNLYPSTGESFGLTIREAGSAGTPSVTIENCATSENIIDNETGFISTFDSREYANKIKLAIQNKDALIKVGNNAKNTFSLSWDSVADLHIKEYKKLLINKTQH